MLHVLFGIVGAVAGVIMILRAIGGGTPRFVGPGQAVAQAQRTSCQGRLALLGGGVLFIVVGIMIMGEARFGRRLRVEVGKPFPAFSFQALDGREVSTTGLLGRVVLIDFWASWAAYDVEPRVALYEKYREKGFEIVGISLDEERPKLDAYLRDHRVTWPQYYDGKKWKNAIYRRFGFGAVPMSFLLDRDGIVRYDDSEVGRNKIRLTRAVDTMMSDVTRLRDMLKKNDVAAAKQLARSLSAAQPGDADVQNEMAWSLVTVGTPDAEILALAAEIAEKANALAQGGNASILDTLARVLFMKGERAKAIAVQEKALAGAGLPHRREYQNTLDSYRAGKLPPAE